MPMNDPENNKWRADPHNHKRRNEQLIGGAPEQPERGQRRTAEEEQGEAPSRVAGSRASDGVRSLPNVGSPHKGLPVAAWSAKPEGRRRERRRLTPFSSLACGARDLARGRIRLHRVRVRLQAFIHCAAPDPGGIRLVGSPGNLPALRSKSVPDTRDSCRVLSGNAAHHAIQRRVDRGHFETAARARAPPRSGPRNRGLT